MATPLTSPRSHGFADDEVSGSWMRGSGGMRDEG